MRILITGATGLIGNELVALLLQNGVQLHYLTTSRKKIADESNFKGFYWNPEQGIIDENCLMGVDVIIHLAGATISKRWTRSYKQEIIESRVITTNLLFKAVKANPGQVRQIISASAIGIYRDSLKNVYFEDSKIFDEGFLGNVVIKWEQSVDKFKLLDIKVCKLRTGLVLSNKGGALIELMKPIKMGLGAPFGSGKQIQSWIHIHDLVEMYFYAARHEWEGVYNAVAPNPVTNKELTVCVARNLHKPLFMPKIPEFLMQLVLGEMHQLLYSSQYVSEKKALEHNFEFQYKTLEKALDHLLTLA
ncbi:TIGR01777 family oxidoreductase [Flavobacterium sp. 3HN19-14]|uniref:TIGR01777 family oxidoreductase n=1 Tax=Flavobacterium sp. 3HN19-14 TaxID=3448133 RepID=UPI003EE0DE49